MGFEGFSKAGALVTMDPIRGGRKEFMYLFAFALTLPFLAGLRRMNEDGMRAAQGHATNKYSRMPVAELSSAL